MSKFCPECGVSLEKDFKFCPECGFKLEKPNTNTENQEEISSNVLICENCGEENNPENLNCSGCGAKLQEDKKVEPLQSQQSAHQNRNSKKTNTGRKNKKQVNTNVKKTLGPAKSLSKKHIAIILSVAGLAIVLILIFSGVFDVKEVTPSKAALQQNSGIDLSHIQEINALEAKVKANPKDEASILALAHLKNDSGLYEQAIVNYKQYLALEPKNADARIDMGVCYYNLGNFKTAINEMEKALKYAPKHQIGFLNLGVVNLSAGNMEKAKEWLKKAVDVNPNNEIGKRAQELLDSHTK